MKGVLKKNKGITLIEVLVVIVISAILFSMLASIFYSFSTLYSRFDNQNQAMNELLIVKSTISNVLDENNTSVLEIEKDENSIQIYTGEKYLYFYLDTNGFYEKISDNEPSSWDDVTNLTRLSNISMIKSIDFEINDGLTIIKCNIGYTINKNDTISYYSFAKALRCK